MSDSKEKCPDCGSKREEVHLNFNGRPCQHPNWRHTTEVSTPAPKPTYYVRHPDDTYSVAEPQPTDYDHSLPPAMTREEAEQKITEVVPEIRFHGNDIGERFIKPIAEDRAEYAAVKLARFALALLQRQPPVPSVEPLVEALEDAKEIASNERFRELLERLVSPGKFPNMSASEGHELYDFACGLADSVATYEQAKSQQGKG